MSHRNWGLKQILGLEKLQGGLQFHRFSNQKLTISIINAFFILPISFFLYFNRQQFIIIFPLPSTDFLPNFMFIFILSSWFSSFLLSSFLPWGCFFLFLCIFRFRNLFHQQNFSPFPFPLHCPFFYDHWKKKKVSRDFEVKLIFYLFNCKSFLCVCWKSFPQIAVYVNGKNLFIFSC